MPIYRVISEVDVGAEHRESRGTRLRLDESRVVTLIEAETLALAIAQSTAGRDGDHHDRRITSAEEIHPGFTYTDDQLGRALEKTFSDWPDVQYNTAGVIDELEQIAYALEAKYLVPGLSIVVSNRQGRSYLTAKVFDDATRTYLSRGAQTRRFTDGHHRATGKQRAVTMAERLIAFVNDLQ